MGMFLSNCSFKTVAEYHFLEKNSHISWRKWGHLITATFLIPFWSHNNCVAGCCTLSTNSDSLALSHTTEGLASITSQSFMPELTQGHGSLAQHSTLCSVMLPSFKPLHVSSLFFTTNYKFGWFNMNIILRQ